MFLFRYSYIIDVFLIISLTHIKCFPLSGSNDTSLKNGYSDYSSGYMAIIDAGSSHTTVLLYRLWSTEHPEQVSQCYNGDGGIDQFAEYPEGLWLYLEPCILQVAHVLTDDQVSRTPIFLGATAGMRLLLRENPVAAKEVMAVVEEVLWQSRFLYQFGNARILTGREEGGYSWITANSLKGVFDDDLLKTDGALDMGGASAQIAFECQKDVVIEWRNSRKSKNLSVNMPRRDCNSADILNFDIYGKEYRVFSKSNQCYGLKETMKRFVVLILLQNYESNGGVLTQTVVNPCLRANNSNKDDWLTEFPAKKSQIFTSRCTDLSQFIDPHFADSLGHLEDEFVFKHVAGWNMEKCRGIIDKLINEECGQVFDASFDSCFIPDFPLQSAASAGFLAMSSYYWEFGKLLNISQASMYEVEANIEQLCNENVEGVFGRGTNCFEVTYIYKMLRDGYGFDGNSFENLEFVEKVEGQEVAWPLGFVINKAK